MIKLIIIAILCLALTILCLVTYDTMQDLSVINTELAIQNHYLKIKIVELIDVARTTEYKTLLFVGGIEMEGEPYHNSVWDSWINEFNPEGSKDAFVFIFKSGTTNVLDL